MATTGSPRRRPSPLLSPRAKYQEARGADSLRCSVPKPTIKCNTINLYSEARGADSLRCSVPKPTIKCNTINLYSVLTHTMATTGSPRRRPSPLLSPRAKYQV
ncbi:hypothetical protein J6590_044824 [Homalodisca vitripennis]|nr:hypothetical protein J6590_044824 [Homalodisca vitripennis]